MEHNENGTLAYSIVSYSRRSTKATMQLETLMDHCENETFTCSISILFHEIVSHVHQADGARRMIL